MARNRQRTLQIILEARNNARKELDSVKSQVENMRPAFRKMATAGTVAFGGLAAGAAKSVGAAAKAEGAWNKFNTVFGDGADDMRDFVKELRTEMPTATNEMARMAADLQDLLVPMGLARDEAQGLTQQSLELANKIAAFNDVDPTEVLEAMRSGFVGMSEPLRRFGVDARVSALEAVALEEGLIDVGESFKSIDPAIRQSVQSQALMIQMQRQSADAIAGFEENQDSFLRRWQDIQATLKEVSVALGDALMPVLDELQKKVLPVLKSVAEWLRDNPKLAKTIFFVAAGLSALLAAVGALGLVLPAIIGGFSALMGPVGLVIGGIAALAAGIAFLIKNWDKVANHPFVKRIWKVIGPLVKSVGKDIKLLFGDVKDLWQSFKDLWSLIKGPVMFILKALALFMGATLLGAVTTAIAAIKGLVNVGRALIKSYKAFLDFWVGMWETVKSTVKSAVEFVASKLGPLIDRVQSIAGVAENIGGSLGDTLSGVIPGLAEGGIVRKPTLSLVGEAGPEAVIPLSKMDQVGGGTMLFDFRGSVLLDENTAQEVVDMVLDKAKRDVNLPGRSI